MHGNHAIIEVKSAGALAPGIRKDLRTLSRFRLPDIHYDRAVYLLYGEPSPIGRVFTVAEEEEFAQLPLIELWDHERQHGPAVHRGNVGK